MVSKKIFIDSTALYAFIDRSDINYAQAAKIMDQLAVQGAQLYTSLHAILETYAVINSQLGTAVSYEFLQSILESNIEILYPQKADLISSSRLIKTNKNKQITLKEALTATMMQKKGIFQILTFSYWHSLLGSEVFSGTRY
jgi:predicted nucleic acid-binding protein